MSVNSSLSTTKRMIIVESDFVILSFFKKTLKHLQLLGIWCIYGYNLIKTMYANLLSLIFILSTTGAGVWFLTQV